MCDVCVCVCVYECMCVESKMADGTVTFVIALLVAAVLVLASVLTAVDNVDEMISGMGYDEKFNKYFPLSVELSELGYYTKVIVLLIGSLGHVHKKFVNGLKILGFSSKESKFMAKFYSTSVIIGSYKVWKQRCKKTNYEF